VQLEAGQVAVVTGAGSGIGRALVERFAAAGLRIVLADVDETAAREVAATLDVDTLVRRVDVSKEQEVVDLAAATVEHFGGVQVVCNNAGVAARTDPWTGPIEAWHWVMGVNFWGVVHGIRAFLPHLVLGGGGHIVNTASIAGLFPGFSAPYDASKHSVVAISEALYLELSGAGLPIGVSVLCPGWVNTRILEADRNWPAEAGALPDQSPAYEVTGRYLAAAVAEGLTPAAAADHVVRGVEAGGFWVIPQDDFFQIAIDRWARISDKLDPVAPEHVPGMPPRSQMMEEILALLLGPGEAAEAGPTDDG